jgi:hypothetical protein
MGGCGKLTSIVLAVLALAPACVPDDDDDSAAFVLDLPPGPPAALRTSEPVVCEEPEPAGPLLSFDERAWSLGVGFTPSTPVFDGAPVEGISSLDVELAGGLAVADLTGNGHLDLLFTDGGASLRFFEGLGDLEYRSVPAAELGLPTDGFWMHGASVVDIDGDGDLDLYLLAREENYFLRNEGGVFVDVTADRRLGGGVLRSASATWADPDHDGDLDAFVANHGVGAYQPLQPYDADRDTFLVQGDDGVFEDRIDDLYPYEGDGYGFVGGWLDADQDGDQDLYVVNDMANHGLLVPNVFLENEGALASTPYALERRPEAGLELSMLAMGLAIGDMDNDMDLDLHVTQAGPPLLARNDGELLFTDVSLTVRELGFTDDADISYATAWFDHDNDGWQELSTTFAHMPTKTTGYGPSGTANAMYQRDGLWLWDPEAEIYSDIAPELDIDDGAMNHASVVADLDRNGFLDMVVWGLYEGPKVLVAGCNANGWLEVGLEMPGTLNVDAIGARVELWRDDGPWQVRQVQAGLAGNFSGGPPEVHFGTGNLDRVHLVVHWPDGQVTVNADIATRQRVWLTLE